MLEGSNPDRNTPTIEFYRGLGTYSGDAMTIFRVAPDDLRANARIFEVGAQLAFDRARVPVAR